MKQHERTDKFLCQRFDVYVDKKTGEYLEKGCKDPKCNYCSKRPKKLGRTCPNCAYVFNDGSLCQGYKNE